MCSRYLSWRGLLLTARMHCCPLPTHLPGTESRVREHIPSAPQAPPAREPSRGESLGAHEVSVMRMPLPAILDRECVGTCTAVVVTA